MDGHLSLLQEALRADKEIVLAALNNNGIALEYAAKELQDKEIVLIQQDGIALEYAAEEPLELIKR